MDNQTDTTAAESAPGLGSALGVDARLTVQELGVLIRALRERKHDCLRFLRESGILPDNPFYGEAVRAANTLDIRVGNLQMLAQGANHYDPRAALDASARMIHTLATALETVGAPMNPEMDEWALMEWARATKTVLECNRTISLQAEKVELQLRINQLESYLDKTADGKLVVECEKLYCPKCGNEVRTDYFNSFCDECPNPDGYNEPPLPLSDSACFSTPPNIGGETRA